MSKKGFKAENNYSKDKSKNKGKHPIQMISSALSKAQAERMAKLSK